MYRKQGLSEKHWVGRAKMWVEQENNIRKISSQHTTQEYLGISPRQNFAELLKIVYFQKS